MEISEFIKRKKYLQVALRDQILTLVNGFQEETGQCVSSVYVNLITVQRSGTIPKTVLAEVDVEVDLK